jgi:dihydrofolate reductase
MTKVRVHNFSISLDGFATGVGLTFDAPFGHAGHKLHEWFFGTKTFQTMQTGASVGGEGVDESFARGWDINIGAEIMGRGKFGPQTGGWEDEEWEGWWGEEPPFHTPVFVLTHHTRPTVVKGETTYHFVDATPADVVAMASEAAGGRDVRIGGGPTTVREFLEADLIDYMHIVQVPIFLGRGVSPWSDLEGLEERFTIESVASPSGVTHLTFQRKERG